MLSVNGREGQERTEKGIAKGHKETFWSDGFVHYLDCSNRFIDMHNKYLNLPNCTL